MQSPVQCSFYNAYMGLYEILCILIITINENVISFSVLSMKSGIPPREALNINLFLPIVNKICLNHSDYTKSHDYMIQLL